MDRRIQSFWAAVAGALILLPAFLLPNPAAAATKDWPDVWLVGDSITYDYAPTMIERRHNWFVRNYGVGGNHSFQIECRVRGYLAVPEPLPEYCAKETPVAADPRGAPDVAVILAGTNDIAFHLALGGSPDAPWVFQKVEARLQTIAQLFASRGTTVLFGLPFVPAKPPQGMLSQPMSGVNQRTYLHMQEQMRTRLLDDGFRTIDFLAPNVKYFWDEVVHPNERGAKFLTRRVTTQVRAALKERRMR